MTFPFTNKDINTTEKAVSYIQTASDEDYSIFKEWFIKGNDKWQMPPGHREAVLAAIATRG